MDKDFTLYEEAFALKELGFNEPCLGYYLCRNSAFGIDDLEITTERIDLIRYDYASCAVPTFSQAFRWFRDNGKISEIFSQLLPSNKYKWGFKIQGVEGITDGFLTYEEAELECLKKLIEISKNK